MDDCATPVSTPQVDSAAPAAGDELAPPLRLTPKAVEMVVATMKSEKEATGKDFRGLRVMVVGGGCSGFQYGLDLEEEGMRPGDTELEQDGLKIFIDPMSLQYLDGTQIDYVEGIYGSGFSFKNPNVRSTCGCGSSFSV